MHSILKTFSGLRNSSLITVNERENHHVHLKNPGNGNASLSSEWTPVDSTVCFHPARHSNCLFICSSTKQ
ncbi:hypothetical protein IRJ41_004641 [Triplophysa rosa]|uniref:Uncharacterized protein n=1 Tax=Triplophysa rosa TaxID=992332 RepID=A0A9W8CAV8_TRIRA|nr:hypothetical protein IRJ41_004641 [Triplophysa rosa]